MTSAADREKLWDSEQVRAVANRRGPYPICNLCDCPIGPGQDWDESHIGRPKALGGKLVGCAHRRCNREDGAKVVTPFVAKAKRMAWADKRCTRSDDPLPCGRKSQWSKTMRHGIVRRKTQGQKLAETLERRRIT
jgi:hypothetical protein